MHTTSAVRFLDASAYAVERLPAQALHDEQVSMEAVVVLLETVVDHLLEHPRPLDLQVLAAQTQLTGEQLQDALQLLEARGYLCELAQYVPSAATPRPEPLRREVLCQAA
ncbi:hypothetical protein [Kocuria dechangensis]|nr:hypothetical protein [Kocuria dechangensis]